MNYLDSSFIVDFLDPGQNHHDAATEWMAGNETDAYGTPTICAFEVLRGAARTGDDRFDRTAAFLRTLETPSFGLPDAIAAGNFDGERHAAGEPLSARDTLVACQAIEHGATLVTRDRDFEGISGLDVVVYD